MQISEFRDLLANDGFAATFQTMGQYRTELLRALDGLRAQADARPVAWQYRTRYDDNTSAPGWHDWEELKPRGPGQSMEDRVEEMQSYINGGAWYELRPLYTHPEASAPGLSDAFDEGFMEAANWADRDDLVADMDSPAYKACRTEFLTRASAATTCVACEGSPTAENNPCAVCGRAATTSSDANARIEELRKGLFEARDAMRVMANWVKKSDPAGHSWAVRMVDRSNDVLSGTSAATVAEPTQCEPMVANEDGWCDWQFPIHRGYKMQCCDCGLVHDVEFDVVKIVEHGPDGTWRFEDVGDPNYRVALRMKREAAQQQAEHVGQACGDSAEHVGIQQAEPGADEPAPMQVGDERNPFTHPQLHDAYGSGYNKALKDVLAAQSGQRAGVAEVKRSDETNG
ncbi:hypothetical protein ACI2T7_03565 [Ralstonia nicotianae]